MHGPRLLGNPIKFVGKEVNKLFEAFIRIRRPNVLGLAKYRLSSKSKDDSTASKRQHETLSNTVNEGDDGVVELKLRRRDGFYLPDYAFGVTVSPFMDTKYTAKSFDEDAFNDFVDILAWFCDSWC